MSDKDTTQGALTVKIDAKALEEAMRTSVLSGIEKGVASWEVQAEIEEQAKKAIKEADLAGLVGARISALLTERSEEIAQGFAETVVSGIVEVMGRPLALHVATRMLMGMQIGPDDLQYSHRFKELEKRARTSVLNGLGEDADDAEAAGRV